MSRIEARVEKIVGAVKAQTERAFGVPAITVGEPIEEQRTPGLASRVRKYPITIGGQPSETVRIYGTFGRFKAWVDGMIYARRNR